MITEFCLLKTSVKSQVERMAHDCNDHFSDAYVDAGGRWSGKGGEAKVKSDNAGMYAYHQCSEGV